MLLTLYVLFFAICIVAIGLSIWIREPYYALVGFFFLFYISVALMTDGLDYKTGENVYTDTNTSTYYKYGDNYTGYHWDYESPEIECNQSNPIDCVKLFHTEDETWINQTTTYIYTNYENNYTWWFGFLLAITSAFSFGFVLYDLRQDRGLKRDFEIGDRD